MATDHDDIELPSPWGSEDEAPDEVTVRSLVRQCKDTALKQSVRAMANAEYNERMLTGDQFIKVTDGFDVEELNDGDWPSYVPRTSRNLLRNLSLTWSSRLLEDRPWVACYPAEAGIDETSAHAASKVLEYCRQTHRFDAQSFDAANLVQPHSCIGWKIVWDPLRGSPSRGVPRMENGLPVYSPEGEPVLDGVNEPQGDVSWELVTIFDYATDGAEQIDNARWCYFTKMVDEFDARQLLETAGLEPKPEKKKYTDVWGIEREGVEVTELWWRPDYRFPKGLFCVMVGDKPVQAIPFPYDHHELPLAVWKCGSRRNSPFGSTHVDDAVQVQRVINDTVAALHQQARQIGSVKLLAASSVIFAIQHGNQMIPVDDPMVAQSARYLEPPARSQVLTDTLVDNVEALYELYGLNELLSGAGNVKSGTSAKSIAYLNKLDSMKQAGAARSYQECILRLARQTLKLYQQYVKAPRLAQIIGERGEFSAVEFIGADLAGVDVRLEQASAIGQMRGQVAGDAQAAVDAGSQDPNAPITAQTGIKDTAMARASRDIIHAQFDAALNGEQQQPDNEVDINLAVQELQTLAMQAQGHPNLPTVMLLLQGYRQKLQGMMSAMQPEPSGPSGPQGSPQ